jgi:hypothetical protein
VTSVSRFDAMVNSCEGRIREISVGFSGFAIRQHAVAVQRIWATLKRFDKRVTDPY